MRDVRRTQAIAGAVALLLLFLALRSCMGGDASQASVFVVSRGADADTVSAKLHRQSYASNLWLLDTIMLLHGGFARVRPGGYRIAGGSWSWTVAGILTSEPALHWVTLPEGLRKEQIADRLAKSLGWNDAKRKSFLTQKIATPYDLTEGFYFPDTYLIPTDETEQQVLKRLINRFNEAFAPFYEPLKKANIKYDTAIKLASIVQREAAGASDMPLIAGILWNRLLRKMPLEVDATLQYARGDTGSGYWAPIKAAQKDIDSPFNTYAHPGLPPMPISNPGTAAIEAVLHSAHTPCLYYLHDANREIHCAETYEEHVGNIEKYLK